MKIITAVKVILIAILITTLTRKLFIYIFNAVTTDNRFHNKLIREQKFGYDFYLPVQKFEIC